MNKYYLLFLLHTPLVANIQLPDDGPIDIADMIGSLQVEAYNIRDALEKNEKTAHRFEREIQTLIDKLVTTKPSQSLLILIQQALRRYKVLATLCTSTQESPLALEELIALFDVRGEIIKKIEAVSRPSAYANLILYNLAYYLGRTPSEQEIQSFTQQRDTLILSRNQVLAELNAQLFTIETEILKDRRSWQSKYGSLIKKIGIGISALVLTGITINLAHDCFVEDKD